MILSAFLLEYSCDSTFVSRSFSILCERSEREMSKLINTKALTTTTTYYSLAATCKHKRCTKPASCLN